MRKLTKREIDFLTKLYNDETIEHKRGLRMFLLRHTYEPKYKVGDFVKVTDDTFRYIWGCRIVNVHCQIKEINWYLMDKYEENVQYECVAIDQFGKEHTIFAEESLRGHYEKRHITGKCQDNKNVFEKKSEYSDTTTLM